jgi:hypothetical protein
MGPLPDDARPAFTVTKVFNGNDTYALVLHGGCDNVWGCEPDPIKLKASFANYIMEPLQQTAPQPQETPRAVTLPQ